MDNDTTDCIEKLPKLEESIMNIVNLPADCVLIIFKHISLHDLLTCRQVCHHFNHLVHQFGSSIRTLHLFVNSPDSDSYYAALHERNSHDNPEFTFDHTNSLVIRPPGHLTYKRLSNRKAKGKKDYGGRFLVVLCPNVQCLMLSLSIQYVYEITQYETSFFHMDHNYLLLKWRHSLKSLTLFGKSFYSQYTGEENYIKSITDSVKRCTHLRRLHLINFDELDLNQCTKLYPKLEALTLSDGQSFDSYIQNFTAVKYLRGDANIIKTDNKRLENVEQLCIISSKITSPQFCSYFTNLTLLDLSTVHHLLEQDTTFEKVTIELAKLRKLVHLKLSSRLLLNDLHRRKPLYLCTFPKLSTIQTLHLVDHERTVLKEFKPLHYEFVADKYPSVGQLHISCPFNLHSRKSRTKIEANFRKRFSATRKVEIKFLRYTRLQDL